MVINKLGRVQGGGFFGSTSESETNIPLSTVAKSDVNPLVGDTIVNAGGALCRIDSISGTEYIVTRYGNVKGAKGEDLLPDGTYPGMTAGRAIADGDGNEITATYATKAEQFKKTIEELREITPFSDIMSETVIDATGLDENTWYPVTISLPVENVTRIEAFSLLDLSGHPSWATHGRGFSVDVIWESIGRGWGTQNADRKIYRSTYLWTDISPVRGVDQVEEVNAEYIYVRGGGKYYFRHSCSSEPYLQPDGYHWERSGYSGDIPVLDSPPEEIKIDLVAYLPLTGGTIDGNVIMHKHDLYFNADGGESRIYYKGVKGDYRSLICFYSGNDQYGDGISIGDGGSVIIGAGESAGLIKNANPDGGNESLNLGADWNISFHTNCDGGWDVRKEFTMDHNGRLTVPGGIMAKGLHDFITMNNEFNFIPSGYNGPIYLNFRTLSGEHDGTITEYIFRNGGNGDARIEAAGGSFGGTINFTKDNLVANNPYPLRLLDFGELETEYADSTVYFPWFGGKVAHYQNGYGITVSQGLYRDNAKAEAGYYIGLGWDGNQDTFIKIDRDASISTPGGISASNGNFGNKLQANNTIFGYAYATSNNLPAFAWDKPGSHYSGVGSHALTDTVWFGACLNNDNTPGDWVDDYYQNWNFNGYLQEQGQRVYSPNNIPDRLYGNYTANGGNQSPTYVGTYSLKCNMMRGFVGANSDVGAYMDVLLMNAYNWSDVPYATALGIQKVHGIPRAYIAAGQNGESWGGCTELVTANNVAEFALPLAGGTINGTITFGQSDNYGIRTTTNNYCRVGESGKAFYQIYGTSIYATSDKRFKKNIRTCELDFWDVLDQIDVKEFVFKQDKDEHVTVGLIAQELRDALPEKYVKSYIAEGDDEERYLSINEGKMTYMLLGALKEERKKRIELEERLARLEKIYGL